ncbi:MAG TPA: hypothetical protein VM658_20740 [bacterium]|nr:hypothetical protein [bacterium]
MKKSVHRTLTIIFLTLIVSVTVRTQEGVPSSMKRVHDPIQVPGGLLKDFHGARLDSMLLFVSRHGAMEQIPFQFDERTSDGTFIFHLGVGKNVELANNLLDPQDFLVFRIGDTGDRAPRESWPTEEGIEIELEDPVDHGKSYCYLVRYQGTMPARLQEDTVVLENADPWKSPELPFIVRGVTYKIEGLVNFLNGKYYKTAINKNFIIPKSAGGTGVNILDGQKMRAFCELFFGKIKVESNEKNMIGGIDATTNADVRGYGRQWLTVALPLGLTAPRIYSDVFTYDRIIVSPMNLNIPFNPEHVITRAGIEFGYDLNQAAIGMRFYSPNCMEGVTIDGKMSEREKAIKDDWVPWFLYTGPQGSLIFRVSIDPALMKQTVNKLTYIDDLGQAFPPEDLPGSLGYARTTMEITSVKAGSYNFSIEWYFPPDFYRPGGYDQQELTDFLNIKDAPVLIHACGQTATNEALSPPPLMPKKK